MTTSVPTQSPETFPTERKTQILEHMNADHADAVLRYARHFGGRAEATAAELVGIDFTGIDLRVTAPSGDSTVRIAFEQPLTTPDDAHVVLVKMAKAARVALGEPSDVEAKREAALVRAREAAQKFRADFKTVLLGTAATDGEPDASVAPAILDDTGAFLIYVSTLSSHTRNLFDTHRASVLLIEDEAAAQHLLARKRLTFRCTAHYVPRGDEPFVAAMPGFKAKFGPVMEHLEKMTDFQLIRLVPKTGRLVTGFGQAYDVDPADWTKLSHVGGTGHGHTQEKKA